MLSQTFDLNLSGFDRGVFGNLTHQHRPALPSNRSEITGEDPAAAFKIKT
jgi:hypothetical protein